MTTPRSSSPLNPHASSSSPMTSPTPSSSRAPTEYFPSISASLFKSPSSASAGAGTSTPRSGTRYQSQRSKRYSLGPGLPSSGSDLFSEATTPTESLLWKERFSRRAEERERRKLHRDRDLDKRRGLSSDGLTPEDEAEADRRAQEDDEEIFRRLVILQRNKAHRATLASHSREVGDEDAKFDLPDFWGDEPVRQDARGPGRNGPLPPTGTQEVQEPILQDDGWHRAEPGPWSPERTRVAPTGIDELKAEEERWAREAAEAERAERELEDMAAPDQDPAAEHGSRNALRQQPGQTNTELDMDMDMEMEMDWAFEDMDIE